MRHDDEAKCKIQVVLVLIKRPLLSSSSFQSSFQSDGNIVVPFDKISCKFSSSSSNEQDHCTRSSAASKQHIRRSEEENKVTQMILCDDNNVILHSASEDSENRTTRVNVVE